MRIEGDDVIFSTGTVKYANLGIIGLSPEGNVSEGYDGGFFYPVAEEWQGFPDLTQAECVELAEYMAQKWKEFGDKYR